MVGAPGFEPGASCAQGRRATRLRYAPTGCGRASPIVSHWPRARLRGPPPPYLARLGSVKTSTTCPSLPRISTFSAVADTSTRAT